MDIKKIDKNFDLSFAAPSDVEWFSPLEKPFKIYGVYYDENEGAFLRLPGEIAKKVNDGVVYLHGHTAGGRLRVKTDSPYIILRATEPYDNIMSHMPLSGQCGFSLFGDNGFVKTYMPFWTAISESREKGEFSFDGIADTDGLTHNYTFYFPLYNGVKSLYIGLKKGCFVDFADEYRHKRPILFYGSSITQGGCASKPGDDYINRLSYMLDSDIINLGFSGSAKGEKAMVDYLASFDPSVFVIDYDHNAPNAEHLKNTHYPLYEKIRQEHKDTPVIFMTMPVFNGFADKGSWKERFDVIRETYDKAILNGDKNAYFISGDGFLSSAFLDGCATVDGCHPDSLGFYLMANALYPTLKKILG
ncbi:MAG: hypothetical protein IJ800_01485 [Clostridia bacterium]|nr:hypothetical protein [Clostridia bacterium]